MSGSITPAATTRKVAPAIALALSALMVGGCTTVKATGTSRSGTEQLLLTGAWDSALCKVDFHPLAGWKVFLDPQFVTVADKDWVVSSIRRTMAEQGVMLENNKDKAQVIVEPAFGAYGTDERSCTSGVPQAVPTLVSSALTGGLAAGTATATTSALTFSQYNEQDAVVKAALFAYDAKTGRLLWESGPIFGTHGVRDRYIAGIGPIRSSSLPDVDRYPKDVQTKLRRRYWGR